jgi:glycogen operon protein
LLIYNAHFDVVNFKLPTVPDGKDWLCLIDTNNTDDPQLSTFAFGDTFAVTGRSLVAFALSTENTTARGLRQSMGTAIG